MQEFTTDIIIYDIFEELRPYCLDEIVLYFCISEDGYVKDLSIRDCDWRVRNKLNKAGVYSFGDLARASFSTLEKEFGCTRLLLDPLMKFIKNHSIIRLLPKMKEGFEYDNQIIDSFFRFLKQEGVTNEKSIKKNREYLVRALSHILTNVTFSEDNFPVYLGLLAKGFPVDFWIEETIIHKLYVSEPFGNDGLFFENPIINKCLEKDVKRIVSRLKKRGRVIWEKNTINIPRICFEDIFHSLENKDRKTIIKEMYAMQNPFYDVNYSEQEDGNELIGRINKEYGTIYEDGFGKIFRRYNINSYIFRYVFELSPLQMYYIYKTNEHGWGTSFFQDVRIPEKAKNRMLEAQQKEELLKAEFLNEEYNYLIYGEVIPVKKEIIQGADINIEQTCGIDEYDSGEDEDFFEILSNSSDNTDRKDLVIVEENLSNKNIEQTNNTNECRFVDLYPIKEKYDNIQIAFFPMTYRIKSILYSMDVYDMKGLLALRVNSIKDVDLNLKELRLKELEDYLSGLNNGKQPVFLPISRSDLKYINEGCPLKKILVNENDFTSIKLKDLRIARKYRMANTIFYNKTVETILGKTIRELEFVEGIKQNEIVVVLNEIIKLINKSHIDLEQQEEPNDAGVQLKQARLYDGSFAEHYKINSKLYTRVNVNDVCFSTRLCNILSKRNISTVEGLLDCSIAELTMESGFGKGCWDEIDKYFQDLKRKEPFENRTNVNADVLRFRRQILEGDFSFASDVSDEKKKCFIPYQEAYEDVDSKLINNCINKTIEVKCLLQSLDEFVSFEKKIHDINQIAPNRLNNDAIFYIEAFSIMDEEWETLIKHYRNGMSLKEYIYLIMHEENDCFTRFLDWISFNIRMEAEDLAESVLAIPRWKYVIEKRAKNISLESIGREMNLTRERVRQIEKKAIEAFSKLNDKTRILYKIYADVGGNYSITYSDLYLFFGEYTDDLYLMLTNSLSGLKAVDKENKTLFINCCRVEEYKYYAYEKQEMVFYENRTTDIDKDSEPQRVAKPKEAFTEQEAIILFYYCLRERKGYITKQNAISWCSRRLRRLAVNKGTKIGDTYRNVAGITFQIAGMESAYVGETLFKPASKLFISVVESFRNNKKAFERKLIEALLMSGKKSTLKEVFLIWLRQETSSTEVEQLQFALQEIEDYAEENKMVFDSLYSEMTEEMLSKISTEIEEDSTFIFFHKRQINNIRKAIEYLIQYQKASMNEVDDIDDFNIVEEEKITDTLPAFQQKNDIQYSAIQSPEYKISCVLKEKSKGNKGVSIPEIQVSLDDDYSLEIIKTILDNASWSKSDSSGIFYVYNGEDESDETKVADKFDFDVERFIRVLLNRYSSGMRFDSIDFDNFRITYENLFDEELFFSDEELEERLKECGFFYEGKLYPADGIMIPEIRERVFDYIEDNFRAGKEVIYYKSIYDDLSAYFSACFNLTDEKMLAAYIWFLPEGSKYYYEKKYMSIKENIKVDHSKEVEEFFLSERRPLTYEEVYAGLSHITREVIYREIHSNKWLLSDARERYFHYEIFDCSKSEEEQIKNIILEKMQEDGYAVWAEVFGKIKECMPEFIENNSFLSWLGFRNALAKLLQDQYTFEANIINWYGSRLSTADVFRLFAANKKRFTSSELKSFSEEIDISLNMYYICAIFEEAVWINKNEFLNKKELEFNVEETDAAIESYFSGLYLNIKEVDSFLVFPSPGCEWNEFLLESYLISYSKKFSLLTNGINLKNVSGAIVRKGGDIEEFSEVCALELAQSDVTLNEDEALDYLVNSGLLYRRSFKGIDQVISKARRLRNTRG